MCHRKSCPAVDAVCNYCSKEGYFAKVCQSKQKHKNVWIAVARRRTYIDKFISQHLSGADSSHADSIIQDLNSQKLHYQYLITSVAVVLVVR